MKKCLNCGEEFLPPFGRRDEYCSPECRAEARRKQHKRCVEKSNKKYQKAYTLERKQRKVKCNSPKEVEEDLHNYCLWQEEQRKKGKHGSYGDWQKAKFFGKV